MTADQTGPATRVDAHAGWRVAAFHTWARALRLDGHATLEDSAVHEAAEYFGLAPEVVRFRMKHGTRLLAEEWETMRIDPTSADDLCRFYNRNTSEAFELLDFHVNGEAGYNYVAALEMAASRPGRQYLDWGSGIGSGAILFASHGFDVTLADISTSLLRFAAWRLARRGLHAECIDLKQQRLPEDRFDIVTAFDVLEHLQRPIDAVKDIRRSLVHGGLFCFNTPFHDDPDRPMHIFHDTRLLRHFRAEGYSWVYGGRAGILALSKARSNLLRRAFYRLYDVHLHSITQRIDVGAVRRGISWGARQ